MWYEIIDIWTAIHILMFFILGLIFFAYTKKMEVGFAIGMTVAVLWEIVERFILHGYFDIYIFRESYINSFVDVFIWDIVGLFLAYIYVRRTYKRKKRS